MRVVLSTWGKFHTFHLARQLERVGWLEAVFTTYPRFYLRKEGIPLRKIIASPWLHLPLMAKWRLGLRNREVDQLWLRLVDQHLQAMMEERIPPCDALIALSGSGLAGGRVVHERGGKWICDRSSAHIKYMDDLLCDEYGRFGASYERAPSWAVEKELAEYREADQIVVPSEFARQSFIAEGVDAAKITVIHMGSDLTQFFRTAAPDPRQFVVCYCGRVSFAKGFPYLLDAFRRVQRHGKRLIVAGGIEPEIKSYLAKADLDGVEFLGHLPKSQLPAIYSRADVFVIASLADGWGLVQTEAMSCGVAAISSENTGAADCIEDGKNGFIVPIRSPELMAEKLQLLADDPLRCAEMGAAARRTMEGLGGWDDYGANFRALVSQLVPKA